MASSKVGFQENRLPREEGPTTTHPKFQDAGGEKGKENVGEDQPPNHDHCSEDPPNVDELLASLEATVRGKTPLQDHNPASTNGVLMSNDDLPSVPDATLRDRSLPQPDPRHSPLPPLPSTTNPLPPSPPPPPPAEMETEDSSSTRSAPGPNKRKPRATRQQRRKTAAGKKKDESSTPPPSASSSSSVSSGSQRTAGLRPHKSRATSTPASVASSTKKTSSPREESSSSSSSIPQGSSSSFKPPSKTSFLSHNKKWTASSSSSPGSSIRGFSSSASSPSSSSTSALPPPAASELYRGRQDTPSRGTEDITSAQFIPDNPSKVEIVLRAIHGEQPSSTPQDRAVLHTFPTVFSEAETGIPAEQAPGSRPVWDLNKYVTVTDFKSTFPPDQAVSHVVPRRPSIPFLLLFRPMNSRGRWEVPDFETAADFLNDVICNMYNQEAPFADTYDRTGKWGLMTTILLKSAEPQLMEDFRQHLTHSTYNAMDFDSFPRDVATVRPDLSILLRSNMKSFKIEVLPTILFRRNKDRLAGSLRVLSTKYFPTGEKSQKGESKETWRQIQLKGDDQVMRCLRFIPESSPFLLGVESVQIRGGLRPQEDLQQQQSQHSLRGKRTWHSTICHSSVVSGAGSQESVFCPPNPILAPTPSGSAHSLAGQPPQSPAPSRGGPSKRGRTNKKSAFFRRSSM